MSISAKEDAGLNAEALRKEVSKKYREVATDPAGSFHFHTGRYLARHLGYDEAVTASLPDAAVESFAGVANVFSVRPVQPGERVVDIGSGAGFDCFVAARLAGPTGKVVGVDMTDEMLAKSRATAREMGMANVEFQKGLAERLPIEGGWADVVISNGVINLCPTSGPCSPRSFACCGPEDGWSSPTLPTAAPFPRPRSETSIFGQLELPVVCRVQPGPRC